MTRWHVVSSQPWPSPGPSRAATEPGGAIEPAARQKRAKPHGRIRTCLNPAAGALLERIQAQFGPMQIFSICHRAHRRIGPAIANTQADTLSTSIPTDARAIPRIANHKSGGTMTYSDMGHIHGDIARRFVALNAPSGG